MEDVIEINGVKYIRMDRAEKKEVEKKEVSKGKISYCEICIDRGDCAPPCRVRYLFV